MSSISTFPCLLVLLPTLLWKGLSLAWQCFDTLEGGLKCRAVILCSLEAFFSLLLSPNAGQTNPLSLTAFQNANDGFVRTLCSSFPAKLLGKIFLSPVTATAATSAVCQTLMSFLQQDGSLCVWKHKTVVQCSKSRWRNNKCCLYGRARGVS